MKTWQQWTELYTNDRKAAKRTLAFTDGSLIRAIQSDAMATAAKICEQVEISHGIMPGYESALKCKGAKECKEIITKIATTPTP